MADIDNGVNPVEEDPAAAFLAQQESEIAVIENDDEGFGALEDAEPLPEEEPAPEEPAPAAFEAELFGEEPAAVNGDMFQDHFGGGDHFGGADHFGAAEDGLAFSAEPNGPSDSYAAIAQVDQLRQEPESLRKWREEQKTRLEELDSASKATEAEWKEKARKELEDWHVHQNEQMEKNKANNRIADKAFYKQPDSDVIGFVASEEAFLSESGGDSPGTEWERVARLCDFNPKTNKQAKDVSRMRSVLISLKQTPLVR